MKRTDSFLINPLFFSWIAEAQATPKCPRLIWNIMLGKFGPRVLDPKFLENNRATLVKTLGIWIMEGRDPGGKYDYDFLKVFKEGIIFISGEELKPSQQAEAPEHLPLIKDIIDYLNRVVNNSFTTGNRLTRKAITDRIKEGYGSEDFKKVVDKKYKDWIGTEFQKYLTPTTLFGDKFEKYLKEVPAAANITTSTENDRKPTVSGGRLGEIKREIDRAREIATQISIPLDT